MSSDRFRFGRPTAQTMRKLNRAVHTEAHLVRCFEVPADRSSSDPSSAAAVDIPATEMDSWIAGDAYKTSLQHNAQWSDIVVPEDATALCMDEHNETVDPSSDSSLEHQKWTLLRKALTEKAVHIRKEFIRDTHSVVEHFEIPIVGHYFPSSSSLSSSRALSEMGLTPPSRGPQFPSTWLLWKGRYYSPEFIYTAFSSSQNMSCSPLDWDDVTDLIPLCPILATEALQTVEARPFSLRSTDMSDEDHNGEPSDVIENWKDTVDDLLCRGTMQGYSTRQSTQSKRRIRQHVNGLEYIEFDLRHVCELTAIGTMGCFPKQLVHFPQYANHHHSARKFVNVFCHPNQLSWTTRFTVQIRDVQTGQWRALEHSFLGNTDVGTQVLNRFDHVRARFVRIFPTEFHLKPTMRVALFGKKLMNDTSRRQVSSTNALITSQAVHQVQPTVRFSLYPAVHIEYVANAGQTGCRCEYCVPQLLFTKHRKKQLHNEIIKDSLDC